MSGECDECGENALECGCQEYVYQGGFQGQHASINIGPVPPQRPCPRCGHSLEFGFSFHNTPSQMSFPYMAPGDSMHMECYIQHVIDVVIAQRMKENGLDKR